MSVGYMKDGSFIKLANAAEINVEAATREAADKNLQDQIDAWEVLLPVGQPSELKEGSIWIDMGDMGDTGDTGDEE